MKRSLFITIFLFFLFGEIVIAQTDNNLGSLTAEEAFRPEMPTRIDTLYYPFYNGVQMIEIDHIGYWARKIYYLEQSSPRAMSHSMFYPMPIGNEFFFRDTTGVIVKAFNTEKSLDALTKHFKRIPFNKKHGFSTFSRYHSSPGTGGRWYPGLQPSFDFSGHYKVFTGFATQSSGEYSISSLNIKADELKFGLMDSLGNIVIPVQYDGILPLYENLLVQKNKKWGVVSYRETELVPLIYDSYEVDHYAHSVYPGKNGNVFFLVAGENEGSETQFIYDVVFFTAESKLKKLNNYDKIYLEGSWVPNEDYSKRILFVTKNGKRGLLNAQYEEIVAPQFDIFEYHKNIRGLFRVANNGKFGFWDNNLKQIIPLQYDYAERFGEDSITLVLKDGKFYCINAQGKEQVWCHLTPKWKKKQLGFIADKNYVKVFANNNVFGVIDTITMQMILPFKYKSYIPVGVKSFYKRNESVFIQKGIGIRNLLEMHDEILFYNNKVIVKNDNGHYGVIDTNFRVLIDFRYDTLEIVYNPGRLIYSRNGKLGLLDFSGKDILTSEYDEIRYSKHYEQERDIFQVKKDGKWGIVNFGNETLVPCEYDSIKFLGHWNRPRVKLWVVEKNKRFGVVDDKNRIFIPFEYDGISHLEGNNLWVESVDKVRYKVVLGR